MSVKTHTEMQTITGGICVAVAALLIGLKLAGWTPELSWTWVLAPIWVPVVVIVAFVVGIIIAYAVDSR